MFPLEDVVKLVTNTPETPCHMKKPKGVERHQYFDWLRQQKSGAFAVDVGGHCVTWDAAAQLITDADLHQPEPLKISEDTLRLLGIDRIEKIYRIVPRLPRKHKNTKRRNKRKRKLNQVESDTCGPSTDHC